MKTYKIENFPTWALCAAVNANPIEDQDDQQLFDDYCSQLMKDLEWKSLFFTPETDEEGNLNTSFSYFPEFGKGTEVCSVIAFGD